MIKDSARACNDTKYPNCPWLLRLFSRDEDISFEKIFQMTLSDSVTRGHIGLIHEIGSEFINPITHDK